MSSSGKQEEKRRKKLKAFFDKNTNLSKRWKSLLSFSDKATDEELHKFFNENFYMIYGVFWDTFSAYELGCKKGKHSNNEIFDLCSILQHILIHLSELIRKKWQTRSIATVLEHLLYKENKIVLRLKGIELLVLFIEAVQELEPSQVDLFASSIDLSGFCVGDHQSCKLKIAPLSAPDKGSILLPSNTAGNIENTVKLWESILIFVTKKQKSVFCFWLDLLKSHFFAIYYPAMANRMKITTSTEHGFTRYCPVQIQALNVNFLGEWMKNSEFASILWSSEENIQLTLEILKQSCNVPISEATTVRSAIGLMKILFIGNYNFPSNDINSRLPELRQFLFVQMACVFDINNTTSKSDHITLCLEIIQEFKSMYLGYYKKFSSETQEAFLRTLLQVTVSIFEKKDIMNSLVDTLLDTVLFIWIKTGRSAGKMWEALQTRLSSLFNYIQPIKQIKIKLIQLSLIMKQLIFPEIVGKKKVNINRSGANNTGFETMRKDVSPSVCPDDKPPLPAIPLDMSIVGINWDIEELRFVWHQLLGTFNNINLIKDPVIHAESIQAISDIIEILQQAEERLSTQEKKKIKDKPENLINVFGKWLFEAANLNSQTFSSGISYAIGTLCRLIVRHNSDNLPLELLSHFYGTLQLCLKKFPNSNISYEIFLNSSNIFNLALPGASMLIPCYIIEIKNILNSSNSVSSVKTRAIIILCSLICYPEHLNSLSCSKDILKDSSSNYDYAIELKHDISEILTSFVSSSDNTEHTIMCIWGLCCIIFAEVFSENPKIDAIKNITKHIYPLCTSKDSLIARSALDCLTIIAQISDEIIKYDKNIIYLTVDVLSSNIKRLLMEQKVSKKNELNENLVADHFYCLIDWVMCNSHHVMNDKGVAKKLFDAIEFGVLGQTLDTNPTITGEKESKKLYNKTFSSRSEQSEYQVSLLLESLFKNPIHGSEIIKEAAHILLVQLCNFLQTFPSNEGVEVLSSHFIEDDEENNISEPIFYIYNDFALFSLSEISLPNGNIIARLILRDCTGRYAWNSKILNNSFDTDENIDENTYNLIREPILSPCEKEIIVKSKSNRNIGEEPLIPNEKGILKGYENDLSNKIDQFDELLCYLSEKYNDCIISPSGRKLNEPLELRNEFNDIIEKTKKALENQVINDNKGINLRNNYLNQTVDERIPNPPNIQKIEGKHHFCKLLLRHLGFLEYNNLDSGKFYMIEDNQRFRRSLTQFDKTAGRELSKIGVIYVKEGQDDQKIILKNDTKSPLYAEFVRGLGWPIDIANHRGYLGGLDKKLTTGKTAPYFANYMFEVAFHEITSMPTNPTCKQQIHKKRHVGNDIVHIVYSEHTSDYRPTTITSQFNDAHIVVYPLSNGLFRIQIYRKEKVPFFGPLVHGMCINKKLLPILVRLTSIQANRTVRFNTGGYCRPFPTRRQALEEIVSRFKNEKSFVDVINELL